jgi:adenylate kinase family enzyme
MRLEVLIGMVGSGKSLYARKRAKQRVLCISHNDLSAMLHCEYRYEQGLRECYRRIEEDIAEAALDAGRDVILDHTHLTMESRKRWIEFAGHYDILVNFGRGPTTKVIAVAFPIEPPEVHARRRFEADPRGRSYEEWYMVAQHHHEQWQANPLDLSEGFAEIIRMDANL